MMNSVHFMLLSQELELMKKINKLERSTMIEDNIALHAAETELSEIKMAQQILNDYEAEHFPQQEPNEIPFCFRCC